MIIDLVKVRKEKAVEADRKKRQIQERQMHNDRVLNEWQELNS